MSLKLSTMNQVRSLKVMGSAGVRYEHFDEYCLYSQRHYHDQAIPEFIAHLYPADSQSRSQQPVPVQQTVVHAQMIV
jgi:hypothetical protein